MLCFSFLEWKDWLQRVEQVCSFWRRIISATDTDDEQQLGKVELWKPLCHQTVELVQFWNNECTSGSSSSSYSYLSRTVQLLWQQLRVLQEEASSSSSKQQQQQQRRSYRNMFVWSQRMGKVLEYHDCFGPDVPHHGRKSFRERTFVDFSLVVLPTMERLQQIFSSDSSYSSFENEKMIIRKAQIHQGLLLKARQDPYRRNMWKLETAATSSSSLGVSFFDPFHRRQDNNNRDDDITHNVCDMPFPLNARRTLTQLLQNAWPDPTDKQASQTWWHGLNESTRQALYQEYCRPSDSSIWKDIDISILVHHLLSKDHYKKFMEQQIWNELLDDNVKLELAHTFQSHSQTFANAIAKEYSMTYDDDDDDDDEDDSKTLERDAKILLEIFLQVPRTTTTTTTTTKSNQQQQQQPQDLFKVMDDAMNRWNGLAVRAKNDDQVVLLQDDSDALLLLELEQITAQFSTPTTNRPGEYVVGTMVYQCLEQWLANDDIPNDIELQKRSNRIRRTMNTIRNNNNNNNNNQSFCSSVSQEGGNSNAWPKILDEWKGIVQEHKALREYILVREHAMLALIPLLSFLSQKDCQKLVYAVFSQRYTDDPRFSFSTRHFGPQTFQCCAISSSSYCEEEDEYMGFLQMAPQQPFLSASNNTPTRGHGIEDRLFGLALSKNIVHAMVDFLVDSLFQIHHGANNQVVVTMRTCQNAFGVLPYLVRYTIEDPTNAYLVHNGLAQVLENVISVSGMLESLQSRVVYTHVIVTILSACIATHAYSVKDILQNKLYQEQPLKSLTRKILPLETMLQKLL